MPSLHAQRLMKPGEIVIHHVQRDGMHVIFDLLRESVSQPGEPPHVHSKREI